MNPSKAPQRCQTCVFYMKDKDACFHANGWTFRICTQLPQNLMILFLVCLCARHLQKKIWGSLSPVWISKCFTAEQ
jgi:hypothetical protein